MISPITPQDVAQNKLNVIPEYVIQAFNDTITAAWDGNTAIVKQVDVVAAIMATEQVTDRQTIFNKHWLDVEPLYREAGWRVVYDRPAYNETGEATFTFSRADAK